MVPEGERESKRERVKDSTQNETKKPTAKTERTEGQKDRDRETETREGEPKANIDKDMESGRQQVRETSFMQMCTAVYELYANMHRILRDLHKFAPSFTSFTHICMIHTVFYDRLCKLTPYFTSLTYICTVFYEVYANLQHILRALRKFDCIL